MTTQPKEPTMNIDKTYEDSAMTNPTRWSLRWDILSVPVFVVLAILSFIDGEWQLGLTDALVAILLFQVYVLRRTIARLRAA